MVIFVTPETLVPALRGELDDIFGQVSDAVEQSLILGKATVKEYISTRGTARSGKAGRIETGKMLKSVRSRKGTFSRVTAEGVFGLGRGPYYSLFQEEGFRHYLSGRWVEGMFAVVDSRDLVRDFLEARLKAVR